MNIAKTAMLALLLLIGGGYALAKPETLKNLKLLKSQEVKKELESGRLLGSSQKNEFYLVPYDFETSSTSQGGSIWTFASASSKAGPQLRVDYQIGEVEGKPIFVPVLIPKDDASAANRELLQVFGSLKEDPKSKNYDMWKCVGQSVCTKVCKGDKGKDYCCRYECTKPK
jgi:hypothetical protein